MARPGQIQFTIYPPSKKVLEELKAEAKTHSTSLSNYIFEMVDKARHTKTKAKPGENLAQQNVELKRANMALQEELRQKNIIIAHNESDLFRLRNKAFGKIDSDEATEYDEGLVELLMRGRTVRDYDILAALHISSADVTSIKMVKNQLEELRRFGLVKETSNGWRWCK